MPNLAALGCMYYLKNSLSMQSRTPVSQYSDSEDTDLRTCYLGAEWLDKF
jgi:hypothetical protein